MSKYKTVYMVYEVNKERTIGFSYSYDTEEDALNHLANASDSIDVSYYRQTYELESDAYHDCGDDE